MSLLGFKAQFAGPVERREKRQTIRAKVNGHVIGRPIQLYTGLRTKACRKLVADDPVCTSIEGIGIKPPGHGWLGQVILDGLSLTQAQIADMARLDGFDDVAAFFEFFRQPEGDAFEGFLIRWDWPSETA